MKRWVFDQGQDVILCCSSTRHRRFIDDLVSIMALPKGSRVRLRYGDDVCDPKIRRAGEDCTEVPLGMTALIAHVGFESGQAKFLPLRIGAVVELRTEGSATYLEIELKEFVEETDCATFGSYLPSLSSLELPHLPVGGRKPIGFFCQRLKSDPPLLSSSDTLCWERIAAKFLSAIEDSHAAFPFLFRMEIVRQQRRRPVSFRKGILIAPAITQLEIRIRTLADKALFGSIIQAPIGCLDLQVDHPECQLSSGTRLPIDTTRNLLIARMSTSMSLRPAYGVVRVTARRTDDAVTVTASPQPKSAAGAQSPVSAKSSLIPVDQVIVELPIVVGRPGSRLAAAGLIALAVAVHAFDIEQFSAHKELVLIKAGLILGAAMIALLLGMKPQGGN